MAQRPDKTDFDHYQNISLEMGETILFLHQILLLVYIVRHLFENDTNAKEIDANAVATFRVKFDHVAMDNFHAVFNGRSELGRSRVQRRPCRNSSASSGGRQSCLRRRLCGSAG